MVGGILSAAYMDNVAEMLERNMKDEMVKEAFLEALTTKQIVFKPLKEKPTGAALYQKVILLSFIWIQD